MSPRLREIPTHKRPWDYSKYTDGVRATPEWQAVHRRYMGFAEALDRGDHDGDSIYHHIAAAAYELYVVEAEFAGQTPKPMHELMAMPRFYPTDSRSPITEKRGAA